MLVESGLAETETLARALILSGKVYCGERRIEKPGMAISADAQLEIRGADHPWASRGGAKLDFALSAFGIDADDAVALDIGASSGGFTDVLLSRGARRVYAVDVGYGLLHWKLRTDARVVVLERANARRLTRKQVPEPVDILTCDASFIGLETILPTPMALAAPGARLCALIKPQFEVDRLDVGSGGIVRNAALHDSVCARIESWIADRPGWRVQGVVRSPIRGARGNVEFFVTALKAS